MIRLSTLEYVRISEYNKEVFPEVFDKSELLQLTKKCTKIDHDSLEAAKRGDDTSLREKLCGEPVSCLINNFKPICRNKDSCSLYKKGLCSTNQITEIMRLKKKIPDCWEFDSEDMSERIIGTSIVMDWVNGFRTFLVH